MASIAASIVFSFFLLSLALPLCTAHRGGFSIELLHRDSPQSPYYNPADTPFDRVRAASHRSTSRADYFIRRLATDSNDSSSFHSDVTANIFEYLMTIYVGTPPTKILAVADTGSDITWTQCKPCTACYEQEAPLFDPKDSSSYRELACNSALCQELPNPSCSDDSHCIYEVVYGDRSHTDGILSLETFWFDSTAGRRISIPKLVLGCSHNTNGTFDSHGSGLVGLGGGPLSLISQLGSTIDKKFSYCLVPSSDNSSSSLLNFGDNAVVGGEGVVSTPLFSDSSATFYYLSLEGIVVGDGAEEKITVRSSPQEQSSSGGNIIIDSGTTLILLDDGIVQQLEDKLASVVKLPRANPIAQFTLCFDASGSSSDADLPDITFQFSGAPVKLSPMHTFVSPEEGVVCLAVLPNGGVGVSIYGNIAQQNFHVGYDLGAQKLSIAPADCTKL